MGTDGRKRTGTRKKGFWGFIDNIEGDKVVWIIVFLLIMISILAIFSSTSLLKEGSKDRMDFITEHLVVVGIGFACIFGLYNIKRIGIFRFLSQLGFGVSLLLLVLLASHVNIPGVVQAERINGAWRTLRIAGLQLHVFEVVKVAMVMYLAWAIHAFKEDQTSRSKKKESKYFKFMNKMGTAFPQLNKPIWKRMFYMYIPILIVCILTLMGSGSSALFIGGILIATLLIGGMPFRELAIAGITGIAALRGIGDSKRFMASSQIFSAAVST